MSNLLDQLAQNRWFALALAGVALLSGLGLTALGLHGLHQTAATEARSRFIQQVDRLQSHLQSRFHLPNYGLAGLRASMAATGGALDRDAFRAYVEARDLAREFPGVRGFGFVERVPRSAAPAYEAAQRLSGGPGFTVPTGGMAPDLYVIRYVEPLELNKAALGFDLGSEAQRRRAIERAIDTGEPTLTEPIVLVQDQRRSPGFLYLVPVYRAGAHPQTAEQRRTELLGLVFTPIVVAELLATPVEQPNERLDFRLLALPDAATPMVVYDSERALIDTAGVLPQPGPAYAQRAIVVTRNFVMAQYGFQLQAATSASFNRVTDGRVAWGVGLAGVLFSAMVAQTLWLLARGRARAMALAETRAADLEHLAKVAQHTSNAVVITNRDGRITWVNEGFTQTCGYTLDEARGQVPGRLLQSELTDQDTVMTMREKLGKETGFRVEVCNRAKDGRNYWVDVDVQPLRGPDGQLNGFMAVETDITEARVTRMRLERLAREQEVMLDSELVGIVKLRDRMTVWSNLGLARMFGYSPETLHGESSRLLYADDASYAQVGAAAYPVLHKGGIYRTQLQMKHSSGALLWIDLSGMLVSTEPEESMWMMVDVTAMKQHQAVMEQAAFHDALTGLPNRAMLADRLKQALELAKRQQQPLVVAYLDLDGFKAVNDKYGHDAGDAVLCAVAARLPATLRGCDTVARVGGDEFVLLLSTAGVQPEIEELLGRVQAAIAEPVALAGGLQARVGASMGLAWYPQDGDDAAVLLSRADERMYEAKRTRLAARSQLPFPGSSGR